MLPHENKIGEWKEEMTDKQEFILHITNIFLYSLKHEENKCTSKHTHWYPFQTTRAQEMVTDIPV